MTREFLRTMLTPAARAAQRHYYGRSYPELGDTDGPPDARTTASGADPMARRTNDELGDDELEFLRQRDSFYLATVTQHGWPYMQHRGGPVGFLTAPSPRQLAFADYGGNRQLISTGNLAVQSRVCLFAMDYAARTRLKVLGTASVIDARLQPQLVAQSAPPGGHAAPVERIVTIDVQAFDWNCPKFIPQRYSEADLAANREPLEARIAELEATVRRLGG